MSITQIPKDEKSLTTQEVQEQFQSTKSEIQKIAQAISDSVNTDIGQDGVKKRKELRNQKETLENHLQELKKILEGNPNSSYNPVSRTYLYC